MIKEKIIFFITKTLDPQFKYGNNTLYLSIVICFSLIAYYNLNIGFFMSPDSYGYSRWADDLIKLDFNLYNYYFYNTFFTPSYMYTVPVVLVALSKFFFGPNWQYAMLTINFILFFFSLIIFSKTLILLKIRPILIAFTLLTLTLSVDLLTWPRYILTDTIFSFFVMLTVYLIVRSLIREKFYYLFLISLTIIMFLTRPTSLPFIMSIWIFILLFKSQLNFTPRFIVLLIFLLTIIIPIIFSVLHHLMEIYLTGNTQVDYILKFANKGIVVLARPETFIEPPINFIDNVYLYLIKIIIFFKPYAAKYSTIHTILNTFQIFLIFLSISIWLYLNENTKIVNKTFLFILLLSLFVSSFHSFTIMDFDWRYRFPIILPLVMLLPISLEILIKNIYSR